VSGTTDTETFTLTVSPVNDPPVLTVTSTSILEQSGPTVLTGIAVTDVDEQDTPAPNNTLRVTFELINAGGALITTAGSLAINPGTTGAAVTVVNASTIRVEGTEADLNQIFANADGSVVYTLPNTNFNVGHTGAPTGVSQTDVETLVINVTAVNDPPTITLAPSPTIAEGSGAVTVNQISIVDVDDAESTHPQFKSMAAKLLWRPS
jgi:hypothetical protein